MTEKSIEGTYRAYRYVVTWADEEDGLRWRVKFFLGDELISESQGNHAVNVPFDAELAEDMAQILIDQMHQL